MSWNPKTTIAIGLPAVCLLAMLGWGAVELWRDPLADLDVPETSGDVTSVGPAESAAPSHSDRLSSDHAKYLGSQACAECHADICEAYQPHPMAHSMSMASAAPAEEFYAHSTEFRAPGLPKSDLQFRYQVSKEGEEVTHHERVYDAQGNEICSRSVPMQYAVGSGIRGHSYFRDAGGEIYMSPITWYTGAHAWDLSPAYDKANEHFERRILDGCVFCHVGRAAPKPGTAHVFEPEPFLELSIGCERCHGPGADHVAYQQQLAASGLKSDPIINPAQLGQPYRDDVCFQCHLLGVQRVNNPGHRDFDFRPGQALADIWTVFVGGTKVADNNATTEAVGQADQMLASRCYIESQGAMSCTSCHDPHLVPSAAERVEFYRSKCLACHGAGDAADCSLDPTRRKAETSEDSCIHCHMPRLDANDVPHTSQTDHRVVRDRHQQHMSAAPDELTIYESDRLPPELINRATGILFARQAEEGLDRRLPDRAIPLLAAWVTKHQDDPEAMSALGTVYFLAGDKRGALAELQRALARDPDSEFTLRELMYQSHLNGDPENGIRYGRRLIDVNPHHYDYHGRMAHMLGRTSQWDRAIDSALRAVEIQPWNPQIHGWLAEAYQITGQPDLAQRHRELYEKLSGESVDAQDKQ